MKKVIFALFALAFSAGAFAAPSPSVNEKVLKTFSQTFTSAQDVSWSESKGLYEAHFTFNDINTRVTYDSEGNTLQTIRYYFEQQLPLSILTRVKSDYEGQKIFGVTEISYDGRTEYHIVLESDSNWTIVQADSTGFLAEKKKYNKA